MKKERSEGAKATIEKKIEEIAKKLMSKYADDKEEHGGQSYFFLSDLKFDDVAKQIASEVAGVVEAPKWIKASEQPIPHGKIITAGLFVTNNQTKETVFEKYLLYIDEETGNIFNGEGQMYDYQDAWNLDDYEYWCDNIPKEPTTKSEGE